MMGWHISIYRQTEGGASPAAAETPHGIRLAVWQTGSNGLDWIDELVRDGKAIDLGGCGYPCRYTATAGYLIPRILDEPPGARQVWVAGAGDILTHKWAGKTVLDQAAVACC